MMGHDHAMPTLATEIDHSGHAGHEGLQGHAGHVGHEGHEGHEHGNDTGHGGHMMAMTVGSSASLCFENFKFVSLAVPFRRQRGDSLRPVEHRLGRRHDCLLPGDRSDGCTLRGTQVLSRVPVLEDVQQPSVPRRYPAGENRCRRQQHRREYSRSVSTSSFHNKIRKYHRAFEINNVNSIFINQKLQYGW